MAQCLWTAVLICGMRQFSVETTTEGTTWPIETVSSVFRWQRVSNDYIYIM